MKAQQRRDCCPGARITSVLVVAVYTLLLAVTLTAAAPQVDVQTLDGRTLTGSLAELDAKRLTLETSDGRVSLAAGELLDVTFQGLPAGANLTPQVWVELEDGSSLTGVEFVVRGGMAQIKLCDGSAVELPTAGLATVRWKEPLEQMAQEWSRIVGMERTTDLLVVGSGEVIDYHKGVLGDVSASTVNFELEGELLPVRLSKVCGLAYYHPPGDAPPEAICRISDLSGSSWSVRTLELALPSAGHSEAPSSHREEMEIPSRMAGQLTWTTPGGLKRTQPPSTIRRIDFSHGKIIFLSDLKPESVTFTPYFGGGKALPLLTKFFALREDRNLRSGPLQLEKREYKKGLALHSRTKVVYRLPGRFSRFQATVGIDDAVRPRGNVRLVIYGDDRVLLESTVTGADPPQPVDLDLSGVRRISILADFGEAMDVADHLDLCEARILK